jgi:hypothetical protein
VISDFYLTGGCHALRVLGILIVRCGRPATMAVFEKSRFSGPFRQKLFAYAAITASLSRVSPA